jgi:predicted XRE-type DNA-binding protein
MRMTRRRITEEMREKSRLTQVLSRKIGNARLSWADASSVLGLEREQLARLLIDPLHHASRTELRKLVERLATEPRQYANSRS